MASMADGFKTLKQRRNRVTIVPIQGGGIEGHGQRLESCLHGARGG
jgi:hypothetical protein